MRKKHFTKQLAVVLSEKTYNQVIEETNKKELTVSEWIREAIDKRLELETRINPKNHFPLRQSIRNRKSPICPNQ